jgi:hypothetical protein
VVLPAKVWSKKHDDVTARWNGANRALMDEDKCSLTALTALTADEYDTENMKRALTALTSDDSNASSVKRALTALTMNGKKRALAPRQEEDDLN